MTRLAEAEKEVEAKTALLLELGIQVHWKPKAPRARARRGGRHGAGQPARSRSSPRRSSAALAGSDQAEAAKALSAVIALGEKLIASMRWLAALGRPEVRELSRLRRRCDVQRSAVALDLALYETAASSSPARSRS